MAQLKSTNITGNLAVSGNVVASKIIKLGGTNDDILMGDGSITSKQALIDSLEAAMEGDTNTWREIKVNGTSILGTGIDSGSLNLKAGTNVSISNSGGTVTISSSYTDTDTGATSITVTGSGNAVTAASYDADTRKITLTKGSTFLTSHQSLADYVKGPTTSTDNAIVRFNGTGGKTIQNSVITIDDSGNVVPTTTAASELGSSSIIWKRAYIHQLDLYREKGNDYGRISFYKPSMLTWFEYMSPNGVQSPTGANTAQYGEVTSWARRSLIEPNSGYGWIWETASNTANATVSGVMSLSSTTGNLKVKGSVTASQMNSEKFAITSGTTAKATWQYNSTTDCIELVWA